MVATAPIASLLARLLRLGAALAAGEHQRAAIDRMRDDPHADPVDRRQDLGGEDLGQCARYLEEQFSGSDLLQDVCVVPRHSRNRTQVGAIVYPNLEEARKRHGGSAAPMTEDSVRRMVQAELELFARELAPYKRVTDIVLTDAPLPKTAILKVIRGQLRESYTFEIERWERSASEAAFTAGENHDTPSENGSGERQA